MLSADRRAGIAFPAGNVATSTNALRAATSSAGNAIPALRLCLAMCCLSILDTGLAHAFTISFARFVSTTPGLTRYLSIGALVGQNVPIRFQYLGSPGVKGKPATGFGFQDAHLTFTAFRTSSAGSLLGMGSQNLRLYSFSIKRDTPLNGMSNLLSGTASFGELRGLLGSSAASYQSSTDEGAAVGFTSDFLTFRPGADAGLSWALTGITPSLAISGSNYSAFTSGLAGSFSAGPSPAANVPEGSSMWLLLAGLVPFAWLLRRSRHAR